MRLTLTQTHSQSHSLTLTLSHDHKTLPGASFGSPKGEQPWVMTRARSRRLWWDASAIIAVWPPRRVSLESFMITKRCQGHHLGLPWGSHQGPHSHQTLPGATFWDPKEESTRAS